MTFILGCIAVLITTLAIAFIVTNSVVRQNGLLETVLLILIVIIFAGFIAALIFQNRRQSIILKAKNEQFAKVIDASTNLFKRFAVFDFRELTYKY